MKKLILFILIVIILITVTSMYVNLQLKWRDETLAIREIDSIFLRYPNAPTDIQNPNDPPLHSELWYDRSQGIENAITGIDQGIIEIENAVKIGYLGGEILPRIKFSIDALTDKVRSGEAISQYVMAIRKKIGAKVEKDVKEYEMLLKLSANSQFPLALREIALNVKHEVKIIEGDTNSSNFINNCIFEQNMLKAAELGDHIAMFYIAAFYYFSKENKANILKAGNWFSKCLKENQFASNLLCHSFFIINVDQKDRYYILPESASIENSYNYIINNANKDIPGAQAILADLCWNGQIPEKYLELLHVDASVMWHRKAAIAGRKKSQEFLGLAYSEGKILPRDLAKASKWLDLAANQGAYSASLLGMSYLNGDGVMKDGSSAKSVGAFRLWKVAQLMIECHL